MFDENWSVATARNFPFTPKEVDGVLEACGGHKEKALVYLSAAIQEGVEPARLVASVEERELMISALGGL